MTEVYRIEDLNVGDEIWISTEINRGFRRLGTMYKKRKVERITPKKTKLIDSAGVTHDRYTAFYKSLDNEMKARMQLTAAKVRICDAEYMASILWNKASHLSNNDLLQIGNLCKDFVEGVEEILEKTENKNKQKES